MDITVDQLKTQFEKYHDHFSKNHEFADDHRLLGIELLFYPDFTGEIIFRWIIKKATGTDSFLATVFAKPEDLITRIEFENLEELWEIINDDKYK